MKQNGIQFASQDPHSSLYISIWIFDFGPEKLLLLFFFFNFAHTNNYNTLHLQFITGNCYRSQKRNKKKKKDKVHKNTIVYILTIKRRLPALWAWKVTGTFEKQTGSQGKNIGERNGPSGTFPSPDYLFPPMRSLVPGYEFWTRDGQECYPWTCFKEPGITDFCDFLS